MRHQNKGRKLSRTASHRHATLSALSTALLRHKQITTTEAKAKETRRVVEKLITSAKRQSTHARRLAFAYLRDKAAVTMLFDEVVPKIGDRPGGYTRIVKLGTRMGDAAEMAVIELVDFNESQVTKARPRRASRATAVPSVSTPMLADDNEAEGVDEAEVLEATDDVTDESTEDEATDDVSSDVTDESKASEGDEDEAAPAV